MVRRLTQTGVVLLLLCALLSARSAKPEDAAQPRMLSGTVLDQANHAVAGAVVYLQNERNLAVSTYIAGEDGSYRFNNLSPDADYRVHAESNGHRSATKSLSRFDTHKQVQIDLKLGK